MSHPYYIPGRLYFPVLSPSHYRQRMLTCDDMTIFICTHHHTPDTMGEPVPALFPVFSFRHFIYQSDDPRGYLRDINVERIVRLSELTPDSPQAQTADALSAYLLDRIYVQADLFLHATSTDPLSHQVVEDLGTAFDHMLHVCLQSATSHQLPNLEKSRTDALKDIFLSLTAPLQPLTTRTPSLPSLPVILPDL